MPTIDIPDKMCIKCGFIKWRISKIGRKACVNCSNANARKNHKKGSYKIKYDKNPELYRNLYKKRSKKYKELNKSILYTKNKDYLAKQREQLGDLYIKHILTKHCDSLTFLDIPQELIEIKRKQLLLTRQINNHENKNMWLL